MADPQGALEPIAIAQGILMFRCDVSSSRALGMMTDLAVLMGVELDALAESVIVHRELPLGPFA